MYLPTQVTCLEGRAVPTAVSFTHPTSEGPHTLNGQLLPSESPLGLNHGSILAPFPDQLPRALVPLLGSQELPHQLARDPPAAPSPHHQPCHGGPTARNLGSSPDRSGGLGSQQENPGLPGAFGGGGLIPALAARRTMPACPLDRKTQRWLPAPGCFQKRNLI